MPEVVERAGAWAWAWATTALAAWVTGALTRPAVELAVPAAPAEPLPPTGRGPVELPRSTFLGEAAVGLHPWRARAGQRPARGPARHVAHAPHSR